MDKLAILLLNWNGLDVTKACVDSLLLNEDKTSFDIFILDNGSNNDEYTRLLQIYSGNNNVKIYQSRENLGFTGGNNFLLRATHETGQYRYFLLLNNDTEVDADFVDIFMKAVNGRVGIFGPQVRYFENKELLQSLGGRVNLWSGICSRVGDKVLEEQLPHGEEADRDYIFGCAMLVSKEVIDKIGVLDDHFFIYYEEVDYCVTARANGFVVRYLPSGQVYHKDSVSTKKISGFHIYMMFRNRILFLKKHANFFQYLCSFFYVVAYLPYFFLKYGKLESYFLIRGTIDGVLGKCGNPMAYRSF